MKRAETRELRELLDNVQLTALPQSAIRLIQLSQNPENGPAEFAAPIESDPGLTVQVLRFVNSSYFAFRQEISSVKLAISLVGIRTIKNFALWSAVFSLMPNPKCGPFDLRRLWQDSLRRAVFARTLGKLVGSSDSEDVFAAALLQDMAIPLLAKEMPESYGELLGAREHGRKRLSDLEQERFGWNHAEAGGTLASRWGLPDAFASLIHTHSQDALAPGKQLSLASRIVMLCAALPSASDDCWHECGPFTALFSELIGARCVSIHDIFERVDNEFREFAPLLKLNLPITPLTEILASTDGAVEAATVCR